MKQLLKTMESSATSVKAGPFTHAFKKACEFETELDAKLLVTSSGLGISEGFSATGDEDSESDRIRRRHARRSQTSGSGAGDVGPAHDFVFQVMTSYGFDDDDGAVSARSVIVRRNYVNSNYIIMRRGN
jgi:hypothetical protein